MLSLLAHHHHFSSKLAQWLANIPVAAATTAADVDENVSEENRRCQLRDTVQTTALAVLGHARRQHQDWFDNNGVTISNSLSKRNRL
nr:unnamed protein product [Spirometra erinaceieuropaei]